MGEEKKLADYVIDFFADKGVDNIFEVYGAANGDLIDAFTRNDKTRYVSVMHEQAAGFAAECYAKIKGIPGVALATSGPGGQNFVTCMGNCFYDSVPVVFLTGQVNSKYMRPDPAMRQRGFQETDIVGIAKPVTKYAKLITNPGDIKYELEKAWHIAQEGRPGPILLDFPIDIQKAKINPSELIGFDSSIYNKNFDKDSRKEFIKEYLADLKQSERPSLIIGAGVRHSGGIEKILELGELLNIPLFPTWNSLDIITSDNPNYGGRIGTYGGKGRNFGIQNSDLVLSIGSRISGRLYGSQTKSFLRAAKKYKTDIDPSNLEKKWEEVPFDRYLLSDAKLFLEDLITAVQEFGLKNFNRSEWMNKVREWRDKYDPVKREHFEQKSPTNPYAFVRMLSEEMGSKDILVGDCGGNIVTVGHAFETKKGQRLITNNGNSPMGFSFPGSMGAFLAAGKDSNVVCIIGDGGLNMNIQELQTIKNYNLGFKTFILNNHCYGITRQFQRTNFEGRQEACGPRGYNPPNFIKVCDAYGIPNIEISNNSEAREKIREVLSHEGPMICDVNCHDWDKYEPRNFGGSPIEDMYPYLPRDEFKANMIIEPCKNWENPRGPDRD